MNEIYYEETATIKNEKSARLKYNILNVLSIISYCLILFWVFIFLTTFIHVNIIVDIIVFIIPSTIFVLIGYFLGRFKNKFYIEYDYAFVSGTIRIAKVIKTIKRKFLLEFDCSAIEKIGLYGSHTYDSYAKMPGIKIEILTQNDYPLVDKEFYYIVANVNAEKTIFIFECTKTFIINVLKYSKKTVLEKE